MSSRGPDGEGLWLSTDRRVGLGHRRLAVIGLGEQGAQPMVFEHRCKHPGGGPLVLTYNGEIYNYAELRRELEARGHELRTHCDTEVILHLYEDEGDRLVDRLRGMFAFALWDEPRRRMLLARDPYGIKPLYYRDDNEQVTVASQVRSLLEDGDEPAQNEAAVAAFLLFGSVPEPLTVWEGIRAVPSGSCVVVDACGVAAPSAYFSVHETLARAAHEPVPQDPVEHVRCVLKESVDAHLVSDVEVGVFLSSGLDSSSLLGVAAEGHPNLRAITLGFSEYEATPSDEVPLAREVARSYNARHSVSSISAADFVQCWPAIRDAMDQPSIDGVNTWLVSRAAADAGLKVVLSGLGGDEVFGGYPSFRQIPRRARVLKAATAFPRFGRLTTRALARARLPGVSPKAAGILEYGGSVERLWFLQRGLFMPWELPAILGDDRARHALAQLDVDEHLRSAARPDPGNDTARVAALESGLYMRNQLLRDADWASMAHSLEVRVPLVDARLLRAVAPVLLHQPRPGATKQLLASAPRPRLAASVAGRPKTGFSVPLGRWLTELADHDGWRRIPLLDDRSCPWARRWGYIVADSFGLLGV
jgi:asparagine synthase (glutamine-hydrolysing)